MKKNLKVFSVFLFLFFLSISSLSFSTDIPNPDMWITNGTVRTTAVDGNYSYIGGNFTYVGLNTGKGAKLTLINTSPNADFPKVNGIIYIDVPDGSGGWYIEGQFSRVHDQPRNDIARISTASQGSFFNF